MKSLESREITRSDILKLCEKYKEDKQRLKILLVAIFKKEENIHLFGWFVARKYVELETPDFHKEILALTSDTRNKYVGFGAPRGHAKSTTINFTFVLWAIVFQKFKFGVMISDTVTQSVEFVNAIKSELEDNLILFWLFGNLTSDEWRDGEFVTGTSIKCVAKGAGMKIRGLRYRESRPDLMVFDDLENDERVATSEQRKKLHNWFTKAALPALSKDGRAVIIGTILHHDSLLSNILNNKGVFQSWKTKMYKAISVNKSGCEVALWDKHIDLATLKRMRDDPSFVGYVGSLAFAQEYQNQPFDLEDAIVHPDWVVRCKERPNKSTMVSSAIAVDPAVSEKSTADPTAKVYAELHTDGNLYICAIGNKRMSPQKAAKDIHLWDYTYKPDRIGIEEGVLGLVFSDMLFGLPIIGLKPDKDKVRRLLAVSRFFESGKIHLVQGIKNGEELYNQLIEFPSSNHDDMVDALVYVIRMLLVEGTSFGDVFEGDDY